MKNFLYSLFFIGLVSALFILGVSFQGNADTLEAVARPVTNSVAPETSREFDGKKEVGTPVEIRIPKFDIKTEVESVGLDSDKRMDIPQDPRNTAWYNLGSRPGMAGSAVIAGHKDNEDGSPSVFWDIKNLKHGDKIIVTDSSGEEYTFKVTGKGEYEDASFPLQKVFNSQAQKPQLNLITCEGAWNKESRNYSHRVVIYSELDS